MLRLGPIALGKLGYAFACVASAATLVGAGYSHEVFTLTDSLGTGVELGNSPSVGAMNILVMGLESRTNFQGQDLSIHQLHETHSGNETAVENDQEGSQDTDTLILIHIFANGKKAVGFSIPRDDVVNYPYEIYPNGTSEQGYTEGKIDAAYAYAYDESLQKTQNAGISSAQRYLDANQAGQLFQIQTIESVTGAHIDHFVESNIIGFYELSQQFGGLEVCIQPAPAQGGFAAGANLTDNDPQTGSDNSGFSAYAAGYSAKKGGKQYLHLSPAMSLAYVRARDTLPGVDIGRTARQQAAIEYILYAMKSRGVLSNLTQIPSLLSNARSYLMYDSGLNLVDFAQDMGALSGSKLNFTTLPEVSVNNVDIPGYSGAQDANFIDVPQIQQAVAQAFYGSSMIPSTASSVTVDVYNGSQANGLAGDVSRDLVAMGYQAGAVAGPSSQSQPVQSDAEIFYGAGTAAAANAQVIANVMGVQTANPLSSLAAGHVEVLLGSQVNAQAPGLEMFAADSVNASDYLTGAQQADKSLPAGVQAAANAGSSSDVPAYSESNHTTAFTVPVTSAPKKTTTATAATTNPNPLDGLTTCPY